MHVQVGDTHRGFEGPESDFEARVAAAMAAYSHVPESPLGPAPSLETIPHTGHSAVAEAESPAVMHNEEAPAVEPAPAQAPEAFAPVHNASAPPVQDVVAAHIEAALPAAAAAAAAEGGSDHHTIAQAVHRVMERLKPELVEEIVRELKTKK